uniref:Uncharacterized protein n=1 Tax=Tanacetum cinerariifolium TaxID=118510 RepID=A0A6L2LNE8_TANCI|nr:hypothetical protein [Tanacetum cinerariifolium]
MLKLIDIPGMLHLEKKLSESCGCLLLVYRDDISSREFTIYEMMKGCSVWTEDTGDANVGKVLVRKAKFDGSVHNLDHGAFASGYSCGESLKASDASALADNINDDVIPYKVSHVDDSTIVGGSRPKPSAAGGLKLDPSISKAKFRSLFSENLCEGVYVSIPRKVMEMVLIPITIVTLVVPSPIFEMTNDGFQTVGKKKKGKSKSINGGQIGGHLVKQNVRYEPKATTINQYVLPLSNVGLK